LVAKTHFETPDAVEKPYKLPSSDPTYTKSPSNESAGEDRTLSPVWVDHTKVPVAVSRQYNLLSSEPK
jgi:hypothetical protein